MKKTLLVAIALFAASFVKAQKADTLSTHPNTTKFFPIETTPDFPGGVVKFYEFLKRNIKYYGNETGKIVVEFIVEKDGSLTDITILKGLSATLNTAVVRAVSKSPKWIPATFNGGKPARCRFTVPIMF